MLIEEAEWLGRALRSLDPEQVYPLLDVGSSTARFRTQDQPWIDRFIFQPARVAGQLVVHLDAKQAEGVDVVADLGDARSIEGLAARGFRSVLCSNLLEHVEDREAIARALLSIVPVGGYLFVSGPYRYPMHPDPIDTLYRAAPQEFAHLFRGTRLELNAIVRNGTYLDEIRRQRTAFFRLLVRLLLPFYKPATWRREATQFLRNLLWLGRPFEASCAVLVRQV